MKVTVVIPVRNCVRTIQACVESVLQQKHPDLEVLVMDAVSDDGTVELLRGFGAKIKFISEPDQGTSDAINKGIAHATGDVVTVLCADDRFADPNVVSRVAEKFASDTKLDMLFGTVRIIDPEGLMLEREYPSDLKQLHRRVSLHLPGGFYKRKSLSKPLMRLDYDIANDYEFICRHIFELGCKVTVIPEVNVVMNAGGRSSSNKNDFINSYEKFKIRKKYFGLPYALYLAVPAFAVSALRRMNFRPLQWYRRARRVLGLSPDGLAPSTIRRS